MAIQGNSRRQARRRIAAGVGRACQAPPPPTVAGMCLYGTHTHTHTAGVWPHS